MDATTWERRMKQTFVFLVLINKYSSSIRSSSVVEVVCVCVCVCVCLCAVFVLLLLLALLFDFSLNYWCMTVYVLLLHQSVPTEGKSCFLPILSAV